MWESKQDFDFFTQQISDIWSNKCNTMNPLRRDCLETWVVIAIFKRLWCLPPLYDCRLFIPLLSSEVVIQTTSSEAYWGLKAGCDWSEVYWCSNIAPWHDNSSEGNTTNISLQWRHAAWWMCFPPCNPAGWNSRKFCILILSVTASTPLSAAIYPIF